MSAKKSCEILVAGTGPAGLITALLASKAGFDVQIVGPTENLTDARTTTLMIPALETLERLGIDTDFGGQAAALRVMRIVDGSRRLIRSPVATFHASEIDEAYFGMNIPNASLNGALADAVRDAKIPWTESLVGDWLISADQVTAKIANGGEVYAKLVAAADGRNSPAREAAGIKVNTRPYRQSAFVTQIAHERGHGGLSTEFHTETGPFTLVPLAGNKSSLVWVVTPAQAENLTKLTNEDLSRTIENRMDSMLGKVAIEGSQQIYPLSQGLPSSFAANRVGLVGEAAHIFPPIGAQGLNLGVRDAIDLVSVATAHRGDPGLPAAMTAYERARRPDILARSGAVALLNQSLLSNLLPAQAVRSAGLAALSGFAPLRGFFMREGMRPGSGFTALLSSFRKQIER